MASEDRCRLTYAEGRRIRTEAQKPYLKGVSLCMAIAGIILAAGLAANSMLTGIPISGSGTEILGERILGGDAGAIEALTDYMSRGTFISMMTGCWMGGAIALLFFGDIRAKEALKKANDEKEQRIREAQEGEGYD